MEKSLYFDIQEFEILDKEHEALAAIVENPAVSWAKFILTDDQPNANKQRIPAEEFENIIRSGTSMPIKMAENKINRGHEGAIPIGVITHLKQEKNKIVGLAALWKRERPEDVELIKKRYQNKEPLELSWEILYGDSEVDDNGVENLRNTALCGVTLVGMPAYSGRTPIIAVASKNEEDVNVESLEEFKQKVEELTRELESRNAEIQALKEEISGLREYKEAAEKEKADAARLDEIKAMFKEAGIEKDQEYFSSNKETLLSLSSEALEFMIQEMVAFASKSKVSEASVNKAAPPVVNPAPESISVQNLAEYLKKNLH